MTRDEVLADRLDVLAELASIERDLAAIEATCGLSFDSLVVRERLHAARGSVLQQLHALVDGGSHGTAGAIGSIH